MVIAECGIKNPEFSPVAVENPQSEIRNLI
jgi:hypothetical protein